ncbi:MAG: AsmA family protein [Bacteroidales bacterium]|nr:AsmA family protein [Bacteroidales bacterium]
MKKGWKIALIALGSLLGLVVVAVCVVLWLVFTPSQLTSIVNNMAGRYLDCEAHFGKVNLTLFKTFPDAGLAIDDVYVVNPMAGAGCDSVAHVGSLTVGVDVKKFLKEKEVEVHQVLLDDVRACLFVDADGNANYNVFPSSQKDKDTTKSGFSLDSLPAIDLKKIKISRLDVDYVNDQSHLGASLRGMGLSLKGHLREGKAQVGLDVDVDSVAVALADSLGNSTTAAHMRGLQVSLKGDGNLDAVDGRLKLVAAKGQFANGGHDMVNERLAASRRNLLEADLPFSADLRGMGVRLGQSRLRLDEFALLAEGMAQLATESAPMSVDLTLATDGKWQVGQLLDIVPQQFVAFRKDMDVDAKLRLDAHAVGTMTDSTMPKVTAHVEVEDGTLRYPSVLPYRVNRINADLAADVDMSSGGSSTLAINSLKAHASNSDVAVSGHVYDLLGDMLVDARVKASMPLADASPFLPDSLPLNASGTAKVDLNANLRMSHLQKMELEKIKAGGSISLTELDVTYDSIHAMSPQLVVELNLPARKEQDKMGETHISGSSIELAMNGVRASVKEPDITLGVNNITKEQLKASFDVTLGNTVALLDSNSIDVNALMLSGSISMDSTQSNILRKFNPSLDIDLRRTQVSTNLIAENLYINNLDFHYSPELCDIADADIVLGNSDLQLYGSVSNLEAWLSHEAMLGGELNLTSRYTDVDQIMELVSGMGSDKDSIEAMREEDNVPKEANPFIVPKDVDFVLHTHLQQSLAFGNELGDVAGSVSVKDGVAVLDQIGFVCKAATMQLTALYRSPRPNNLFCAIDFHLLDIQIDELLDMIPAVDTLVPMLAAFDGNANFHLAAETYLNAFYQPKMSTLLGSAAISGKDLVVMDNNSIAQIAKLMQFKSWKDKDDKIKIDSLDVEMTCFRKEIEVFPFLLNIGKYQLCASGKHTLDNQCGYHVELLKNPLMAKVGVDVTGTLSSPKISLGEVRYADLYKPSKQGVVEKETLRLKQMIREALENNVR